MVSSPFLFSLLRLTCTRRKSCARVFSDAPSPSQAFEADLAASLQELLREEDVSSSDLISFSWTCKALDVVISTQQSALQALSTSRRTSSQAMHSDDKDMARSTMEQYMEDSVKLLDVCCLLKEAVAGVDAYVKATRLALKRLQGLKLAHQGDMQRAQHALLSAKHLQETNLMKSGKRLSACGSMLRRMGDKMVTPAPSPSDPLSLQDPSTAMASSALYGAQMCTQFFLRLLSIALSTPASRKSSSFLTPLHISRQAAAWAPALLSLQAQLNSQLLRARAPKKIQRCMTLFPELRILEASMNQIDEAVASLNQANLQAVVDSTGTLIHHLQSSVARLEHQIECLLSALVNIRMTMLD